MTASDHRRAERPPPDDELVAIADYVTAELDAGSAVRETARLDLMDTLACGLLALEVPSCTRLLGPTVPGADLPGGARVPGTHHELDPVTAAWNIGAMNRWLDFNDTWLAAEWGHPSDNLAAILAVSDYIARQPSKAGLAERTMGAVLTALIKAHEIQGVLALTNSFNRHGLDHVLLVRVASASVCAWLLGGGRDAVIAAASHAWLDGGALRAYRHAPQTGPRKSWAAGDAAARGVQLALLVMRGEPGYPAALSAPIWGFEAVCLGGQRLHRERGYATYVMANILFKIAYPAEFHAQTAVEAAIELNRKIPSELDAIESIRIETQEAGARIIDKTGPLSNPADRDHCLQYMVAVALIFGRLSPGDYDEAVAEDPRIDRLRDLMTVTENPEFTRAYHDPEHRAIANAVQVFFRDGTASDRVVVQFPLGHRRRRDEGLPLLQDKFERAVDQCFPSGQAERIRQACANTATLDAMPVSQFMALWQPPADVERA
jgi:2-methylcitrate dehydratase